MIVLCPKAIPKIEQTYDGDFLFHYLKRNKIKAIVTNECWSSLKFKIVQKYLQRFNKNIALIKYMERIAKFRSWLSPENEILDTFGRDISPILDYDIDILLKKTKELVNRKGEIIKYFIIDDINDFSDTKTTMVKLDNFLTECLAKDMNNQDRMTAEEFVRAYPKPE